MLEKLMQLYLHDFSEFAGFDQPYGELSNEGLFAYKHLETYWTEPKREPLLIHFRNRIAGFVLINAWSASGFETDNSVAEFFILRKYRREGIGTYAATKIIRDRAGKWEIPVAGYNSPALKFWRHVSSSMSDHEFEEIAGTGERWTGTIIRGEAAK